MPETLRATEDIRLESVLPSLRNEAGAGLSIKSCSWFSTYRIHHRSASRFRHGRAFLLGDAAHIHSPVGAQGMNTGLQDAYNLAWKLALVVKGQADEALLDSYEEERIPVARRLLNTTDRAFRVVVSDSWAAGLLRTKILARIAAFAMTIERVQKIAFRTVSQTAIEYRKSSLSKSLDGLPDSAPHGGDRFPWLHLKLTADGPVEDTFQAFEDTRFNLVVIGQPSPPKEELGLGDMVRVHVIPADAVNEAELSRASIPRPSFYLVRPDGHVGLCGTYFDAGAVGRYLAETVRLTPQAAAQPAADSLRPVASM